MRVRLTHTKEDAMAVRKPKPPGFYKPPRAVEAYWRTFGVWLKTADIPLASPAVLEEIMGRKSSVWSLGYAVLREARDRVDGKALRLEK